MRAEEFKQNGVFDRSLGDLVMKVCAHVFKHPIMVVTSNANYPYVPFMPGMFSLEAVYFNVILFVGAESNVRDIFLLIIVFLTKCYVLECVLL